MVSSPSAGDHSALPCTEETRPLTASRTFQSHPPGGREASSRHRASLRKAPPSPARRGRADRPSSRIALLLLALVCLIPAARGETLQIELAGGEEVSVERYPAGGDRLLWFPTATGLQEADRRLAAALAELGFEVWLADLHAALFLPAVPSSMERIPDTLVAGLIERALADRRRLFLLAPDRGVVAALRGAHRYQQDHPDGPPIGGLITLSPQLFVATPEPGREGRLWPVVRHTNLPIYLLQPENSPWRWKLQTTLPALREGGSTLFVQLLPGVRDRFYYRPDATAAERELAERLPRLIVRSMRWLEPYGQELRLPPPLKRRGGEVVGGGNAPRSLRPYRGDPHPPALRLPTLDGTILDLAALKGHVVLVNFWASWCPPCVHEMPSMERLSKRFAGRPFTILAVNMAESRETVEAFLETKVEVGFPILLDADGAALRRWKVFAFPTSYLIDARGEIRYALFGAIDWDTPEVHQVVERLLAEGRPPSG
ncbi:MAG TPA: TlpA family protein disulfide reductase [Thiotrichales bacterium]|nr:TlpA family protein disulfide reductase [Thiotrichales bacterium]